MISGAHTVIYSKAPDADRAFFRDIIELENVDVGGGWLVFSMPASELAVHPSDKNNVHELFLICEDIDTFMAGMESKNIACSPVLEQDWGLLTRVTLPGGGKIGVYEPRHARP